VTGDCHAGICGSPGVRSPRATRPLCPKAARRSNHNMLAVIQIRTESPVTLQLINPEDLPAPPHLHPCHHRDRNQDGVHRWPGT
jgi:hypothetical protein